MSTYNPERDVAYYNRLGAGTLPELMGIQVLEIGQGRIKAQLEVRKELHAPNGFLHAGTVVTLADTACGYACSAHLPAGAKGFTTIELKSNHLGTALDGVIEVEAHAEHLGRTTHVWDAKVRHQGTGKTIALFRCTQMIL
ncbi:MAG: PaaI family thioesterase [Comamonadaceae bacterium]|nr:MAG: PaaI family thioesterase [Comamonadaceae bacterium]